MKWKRLAVGMLEITWRCLLIVIRFAMVSMCTCHYVVILTIYVLRQLIITH